MLTQQKDLLKSDNANHYPEKKNYLKSGPGTEFNEFELCR